MNGGDGEPDGENDQRECVDEGGEDSGALVAEGLLIVGRPRMHVDSEEGEAEGEEVGDVVAGFRKKSEGVGAQAEDEGEHDVSERREQGKAQNARGVSPRAGVDVHQLLVYDRRRSEQVFCAA